MTTAAQIQFPTEAPVMVLPGGVLFPGTILPLRIFEPRYREMLTWALERDRMFCIALMKPGITEAQTIGQFHHHAGLGLIRASVTQPDGTSNLMLQGISRVRFAGFSQATPFRIARLEPQPDIPGNAKVAARLAEKVRSLCSRVHPPGEEADPSLVSRLGKLGDPGALADFVAGAFIHDPFARQALIEEPGVNKRLRDIIRHLENEVGGPG